MTKRITCMSAAELMGSSTAMKWIVQALLVEGSSMMIYGRQGVGKSTLMLQLAAALATGTDWLVFETLKRGSTLWLQLDMPKMELRGLLMRADTAKLFVDGTRHAIKFAQFWDEDQEVFDFDILADTDQKLMETAIFDLKPVCLMVDTGNDVFQARQHKELGNEIRKVLRRLRGAIGKVDGASVYSQHQRKRQLGIVGDDPDAFLGRVEWETVASSSVQLEAAVHGDGDAQYETYTLTVRKHRLQEPGFRELALVKNEHGFFVPKWTATTALACWPRCVPPEMRNVAGKEAVLEAIQTHLKIEADSLRKAAARLRGVEPWTTKTAG